MPKVLIGPILTFPIKPQILQQLLTDCTNSSAFNFNSNHPMSHQKRQLSNFKDAKGDTAVQEKLKQVKQL